MSSSGQQSCQRVPLTATASPVSGVISRPYLGRYTPAVTYRITLGTGQFRVSRPATRREVRKRGD